MPLSTLPEKYGISPEHRKLKMGINGILIHHPEKYLVDADEISSAEITTDRYWIHAEDADSCEPFINFVTKKHQNTTRSIYH